MRKIFEFLLRLFGFIKKPIKLVPTPKPSIKPTPPPSSTPKPKPSSSIKPTPSSSRPIPSPTPSPLFCKDVAVLNKVTLISGSLFEYDFTPGEGCVAVYLQYTRDPELLNWVTFPKPVSCDSPQQLDVEITMGTIYFAIATDCFVNLSPSNVVSYTFPE